MSRLGSYTHPHVDCWRRDDLDLRDGLPCTRAWYIPSDRCSRRSAGARAPQRRPWRPFSALALSEGHSSLHLPPRAPAPGGPLPCEGGHVGWPAEANMHCPYASYAVPSEEREIARGSSPTLSNASSNCSGENGCKTN